MKICAIICEFNPFHNGHAYLIGQAKKLTGCDAVLCVMSGSFTQRGDMCVLDKYTRARHAVLSGADAVLELPASFAVAPAEIFALGGVKIIASLPQVKYLAFGCENGGKEGFLSAAELLNGESELFKRVLSEKLDCGESYIKSVCAAFEACGGRGGLLSSPNDILGVEYAKAVLNCNSGIEIVPVRRVGAGYNDDKLADEYSSASGIRANRSRPQIKRNMPEYSYKDFIAAEDKTERFGRLAADYLFLCDKENLKRVYGCTEGLENRLKSLASGNSFDDIVGLAAGKRYSKARIKRILTANLLGLYADQTQSFLQSAPLIKVLAVNKRRADELLPLLSGNGQPGGETQKCGEITTKSYLLWRHLNSPLSCDNPNEKMILI